MPDIFRTIICDYGKLSFAMHGGILETRIRGIHFAKIKKLQKVKKRGAEPRGMDRRLSASLQGTIFDCH
jgi:hypothetical protein